MEPPDLPDRDPDEFEAQVVARARDRLSRSGYPELGRVAASYRCGLLTLRGVLPSQYLKQVAQELVGRLEGVNVIVNQIEVRVAAGRGPSGMEALRPRPDPGAAPDNPARGDSPEGG